MKLKQPSARTVAIAKKYHANHLSKLGVEKTMAKAGRYNRVRYAKQLQWREQLFHERLDE